MQKGSHPHLVEKSGRFEFILVPGKEGQRVEEIAITQKDVREVQLGKAAIQAALQILLEQGNISATEIDKIIIAGAFGSYLDISNAVAIGLLPGIPLNRVLQVGNAAGTGARILLLSATRREEIKNLLTRIKYLELGGAPKFSKAFTRACLLGPYNTGPNAASR